MGSFRSKIAAVLPRRVRDTIYRRLRASRQSRSVQQLHAALGLMLRYEMAPYEPVSVGGRMVEGKRGWQERWGVIRSQLEAYGAGSVLDIGCAEGWFLRRAAEDLGCFALGIEHQNYRFWRGELSRMLDDVPRMAIMKAMVDPEDIRKLPRCDFVLCLSVVHHVIRANGLEGGRAFLAAIAERTNMAILFEMGSSEENAMEWVQRMPEMPEGQAAFLKSYLESAGFRNVREVGETPSIKREASRLLMIGESPSYQPSVKV